MTCYVFKRPGQKDQFGQFANDYDARRYATIYGFTSYSEGTDPVLTEYDVVNGLLPDNGDEYVVSDPAYPGQAVADTFAPVVPTIPEPGDWTALEGNTSDIASVVTDVYVDPNVALYAVTRTLEITVPVYAASKGGAISAVRTIQPEDLLKATGAEVRTYAHSAIKSLSAAPLGDPWTEWLNGDRAGFVA